jgi:hypothetical protein
MEVVSLNDVKKRTKDKRMIDEGFDDAFFWFQE